MKNVISETELLKIRLDYSYKWFDGHAKQRMSLLNFFLIMTGILINAYVLSVNYELFLLGMAVCILGMFQSIAFIIFDIRNRQLISYSEDILEKLERDFLFSENYSHPAIRNGEHIGLLFKDSENKMREGHSSYFSFRKITKMKWWMRFLYLLVAFTFMSGLLYVLFCL